MGEGGYDDHDDYEIARYRVRPMTMNGALARVNSLVADVHWMALLIANSGVFEKPLHQRVIRNGILI